MQQKIQTDLCYIYTVQLFYLNIFVCMNCPEPNITVNINISCDILYYVIIRCKCFKFIKIIKNNIIHSSATTVIYHAFLSFYKTCFELA